MPGDSPTTVAVLTPAGAGAVGTVAVTGPRAWGLARELFRPVGAKPLPDAPEPHQFWVGRLAGGDEVVLAVRAVEPAVRLELHGHGGRRVVRWVVEQFTARSCVEVGRPVDEVWGLLARAPTLRTANVLLDQAHGAFDRAVRSILAQLDAGTDPRPALAELARYASAGQHLVEPWRVVVAGPPNVGKSSLVNALAGYQRSVVSPVPGTTRDVVTTTVAFDGWPVELADTAGLRDATGLEGAGVERARALLSQADLVTWVTDASADELEFPDEHTAEVIGRKSLYLLNKSDIGLEPRNDTLPGMVPVSALTGDGIAGLVAWVAHRLVPAPPPPGAAVPYSPALADRVAGAHAALAFGQVGEAARLLRACLVPG
jgi:tRNA modification GTPase